MKTLLRCSSCPQTTTPLAGLVSVHNLGRYRHTYLHTRQSYRRGLQCRDRDYPVMRGMECKEMYPACHLHKMASVYLPARVVYRSATSSQAHLTCTVVAGEGAQTTSMHSTKQRYPKLDLLLAGQSGVEILGSNPHMGATASAMQATLPFLRFRGQNERGSELPTCNTKHPVLSYRSPETSVVSLAIHKKKKKNLVRLNLRLLSRVLFLTNRLHSSFRTATSQKVNYHGVISLRLPSPVSRPSPPDLPLPCLISPDRD